MLEHFWSTFLFVLEAQRKCPDYRWYLNSMLAKSMDFCQYPTNIFVQNHLQQKVLDGFQCESEFEVGASSGRIWNIS